MTIPRRGPARIPRDFWNAPDSLRYIWLWLCGHARHWRTRYVWVRDKAPFEVLEGGLASFQMILGGFLLLSHDQGTFTSTLFILMARHAPDRAWGCLVVAAALCSLVGIAEWDTEGEHVPALLMAWNRRRTLSLMWLRLVGLMSALLFWAGSGLLLIFAHPAWPWGWGYLLVSSGCAWLIRRVGGLFVHEEARQDRRARGLEAPPVPSASASGARV